MKSRRSLVATLFIVALMALGALGGWWARGPLAVDADQIAAAGPLGVAEDLAATTHQAGDPLILSYAAKFVCREPLQAGQVSYGTRAPIVEEKTDVLVHNPNDFRVIFYKKAVIARLEDAPPIDPGGWRRVDLAPDHALRVDCDDIAVLLTGDDAATFIGTYGIGTRVEGFVVIGVGFQTAAGVIRYSPLDVTAEYARSSEVLKKDVPYQPWWKWWWWPLPWNLGYAYQRVLQIDPTRNIDCRSLLYMALAEDAQREIADPKDLELTLAALENGRQLGPDTVTELTGEQDEPALVAMLGGCDKIDATTAAVDYVLLSNKGSTDPDPRLPGASAPAQIHYPWIPGRWHDLAVVMPQNVSVDLDHYIRQWHAQRWIDAGEDADTVQIGMVYFFPWWCGWGYWSWWWNGGSCTDIGVGEGESIDVEQVTPVRVFVNQWPPQ